MRKLVFLLVVVVILYVVFKGDDHKPVSPSSSVSSETTTPETAESDGSDSGTSSWGSGHQAGYDWAEEKGIDDESDCEEAGDHSNSPSFAEGCKAYVEEHR